MNMSDWEDDARGPTRHEAPTRDSRDYGDRKPTRRYDFQDKIDLRTGSIGRIIGRGGSNIQKLESDFNVRVELDKVRGTVTVSGNNNADVENAMVRIKDQMQDSDTRGGGGGDSYSRRNDYDKPRNSSASTSRQYSSYDSNSNRNHDYARERQDAYGFDDESSGGLIDWDALNQKAVVERKKRWEKCPPLRKHFYNEDPDVANMSLEDAEEIRSKNNSTTVRRVFAQEDADIPNPVTKFEQCFSMYPDLMAEIQKQDFRKPSPIQAQAWPILLKGEDMIGIAQTGTGKTLAFLLPAMIHTEYQETPRSQRGGPNVLVMAPTRELALQIEKEVNKYSFRGMKA